MSVHFYSADVRVPRFLKRRMAKLIKDAIVLEGKEIGKIDFVFCSDDYLLEINKQYLDHDFYTDIITFDYTENNVLSGELYISYERVKENAITFGTGFQNEIARVMIHGVLHLIGYKDNSIKNKISMTKKENFYLRLLFNF